MDIEKLKVAELRVELANRELDTKGTKPVRIYLYFLPDSGLKASVIMQCLVKFRFERSALLTPK